MELDEPLSTDVSMKVVMNSEAAVIVDFDDVPVESMELIDTKLKQLIKDILQEGSEFFDMNRIHTISKLL